MHWKICHLSVELFGKVIKRDEHLQNMNKFEKVSDLHQKMLEQRRTLPKTKFIIERVSKNCAELLQNMKVEHCLLKWSSRLAKTV